MASLKYIFAESECIKDSETENSIIIYPVSLKDYDKFTEVSHLLYISKNHFEETEIPLLALVFMSFHQLGLTRENLIEKLITLFSIVTREEVIFFSDEYISGFLVGGKNIITIHNYDAIRELIMKQNLMFEQKIFKNKLVQEWANKVMETKAKNSPKITMEDMITTVSVFKGKDYDELQDYTIYQIYADFYRIRKMKYFDVSVLSSAATMGGTSIEDFAEEINMFHNPYDDLFVSTDKLNKLNAITKS